MIVPIYKRPIHRKRDQNQQYRIKYEMMWGVKSEVVFIVLHVKDSPAVRLRQISEYCQFKVIQINMKIFSNNS